MNADQTALDEFRGVARLFPLPGLVLFPHAVQPLHIFEPRYRQMTADAISGDRLIALVLLQSGWEESYDDKPRIYTTACLGRIVADQSLSDGRYNLLLRGLTRIRILDEINSPKLYREARVEVIHDHVNAEVDELMSLRTAIADLLLPRVSSTVRDHLQSVFQSEMPLGQVCDVLSFALPLPPETKQVLLETSDVVERAKTLMEGMLSLAEERPTKVPPTNSGNKRFPPEFSSN